MTPTIRYQHDISHCLTSELQPKIQAHVQTLAAYESILAAHQDMWAGPILRLCEQTEDLSEIEDCARQIRARFRHIIICGAGGSGLSGRVLTQLKLYHDAPKFYTLDNIDPSTMEAVMSHCPAAETLIIAISKSGSTAETLSQFYALRAHFMAQLPQDWAEHFIVITTDTASPLRSSAHLDAIRIFTHPADIGGRFSLFTSVGLLPAAIADLNIRALRQGASEVARSLGHGIHPARLGAALQYAASEQKKTLSVMLPYCERLAGFSAWYRQSWAESLAKQGKGTTPISAVGTTDQHSQLQLYLDGPDDKFFTMILHARAATGQPIQAPNLPGLEYLQGKTTGDIMAAEQQATLETLIAHHRLVRVIRIEMLDETVLGALLMHFMLEIFFMAQLQQVNAFDQPAVEEGKQRARDYLLGHHIP